jgi:hypothetical protein
MNVAEWAFAIIWPVVVVVLNNLLAGQQLKHVANVTCENFNRAGRALAILLDSIRGIEEALEEHGIEIAAPIDSRSSQDVWRIAR